MSQQTEKKITLRPLGNRVLAKRLEQEETVKGGILLPDSAKKKQEMAQVVAVGKGKMGDDGKLLPMPVKVGNKILMDQYSGQEISIDHEELIVLKADDIIAVIED